MKSFSNIWSLTVAPSSYTRILQLLIGYENPNLLIRPKYAPVFTNGEYMEHQFSGGNNYSQYTLVIQTYSIYHVITVWNT